MSKSKDPRRAALEKALDLFREWGRQGGKTRAKKLTAVQRREIARKAAASRWRSARRSRGA